jgi:hypothetical protein
MSPHVASTCTDFLEGSFMDFKLFVKDIENDA